MKKLPLDARDMPCPRPLLKTKEAMEKEDFDQIEILVNNAAARENICRFLNKTGMQDVSWTEQDQNNWIIRADRSSAPPVQDQGTREKQSPSSQPPAPERVSGKVVLIGTDKIGRGDDALGALLMKGFLYTLTQLDTAPEGLIFMNCGVKLACAGSESLKDLQTLEEQGCRILVCGTCLDYLKLQDQKQIGTVSNMYEIAGLLMEQPQALSLT